MSIELIDSKIIDLTDKRYRIDNQLEELEKLRREIKVKTLK